MRVKIIALLTTIACLAGTTAWADITRHSPDTAKHNGQHDFDFEFGAWKTELKRLLHPLTGSTTWVEYSGTTDVSKVWAGATNMVQLDVSGPAGRIRALSLRLYNTETGQWGLNFSAWAAARLVSPPWAGLKTASASFMIRSC